jgi:exosortase/archaeosortase family protein
MKTDSKDQGFVSVYGKTKKSLNTLINKKEYRAILFFAVFLVLYKVGDFIWEYIEMHRLFQHTIQLSYNFLIELISAFTAWFYSFFYKNVVVTPGGVININGSGVIYLATGCSGLKQILLIVFIMAFYPISFKLKTFLTPISVLIILAAVILHFVLLVPVAMYYPAWFLLAHDYFMIVLFYGFFFLTWVLWERVRIIVSNRDKCTTF